MIDISDGLASEIFHICKASKVGCQVYENKIPIDSETYKTSMDFNINPTVSALNGGEDMNYYSPLIKKIMRKLKMILRLPLLVTLQKKIKELILIGNGNTLTPLKAQGWNHFNN